MTPKETVDRAVATLESLGYEVRRMPNEWHLKVGTVNYWPTTGKWYDDGIGGRGGREATLIRHLAMRVARAEEDREIEQMKADGTIV